MTRGRSRGNERALLEPFRKPSRRCVWVQGGFVPRLGRPPALSRFAKVQRFLGQTPCRGQGGEKSVASSPRPWPGTEGRQKSPEPFRFDGLEEVVVESRREALLPVGVHPAADDREEHAVLQARLVPQAAGQFPAVHVRQADVEQDDIRPFGQGGAVPIAVSSMVRAGGGRRKRWSPGQTSSLRHQ